MALARLVALSLELLRPADMGLLVLWGIPDPRDKGQAMSELLPRDTHVLIPSELRRLSGQNALLFARLCQGPATRRELAAIATNPTARISDLRAYLKPLGQTVKLLSEDHRTGRTVYGIVKLDALF